MKHITKIDIKDTNDFAMIAKKMEGVVAEPISCINWKDQYPSAPKVSFKIAHNGAHLFLQYFVEEDEILAKTTEDNGPVWTDSCVEFFIAFGDSPQYYNLELSCIGTALLGYRESKENAQHASPAVMATIGRQSTLGSKPFDKKKGSFEWSLIACIPASAFWMSGITNFEGIKARANAYKCGDNLSVPHFLTWKPIDTPSPNFHVPQFFTNLTFEQ